MAEDSYYFIIWDCDLYGTAPNFSLQFGAWGLNNTQDKPMGSIKIYNVGGRFLMHTGKIYILYILKKNPVGLLSTEVYLHFFHITVLITVS